jgi:hypothetical protein
LSGPVAGGGTGGAGGSGSSGGSTSTSTSTAAVGGGTGGAPTTVTAGSGRNAVVVTVPSRAVRVAATVTVTTVTTSTLGGGIAFAAGTQAVRVTVHATNGGGAIVRFGRPLDLAFPGAPAGIVPAYSPDGKTWVKIPRLRNPPTLPPRWKDGWYVDDDGTLHILTRHATYFGALAPGSRATSALQLSFRVPRTLNVNYRHTLVLHATPTFPATLTVVLRRGGKKVASWRAALQPAGKALRLVLPKAARRAGKATLVLTLAGAGETTTRRVPIAIVARWAHR